MKNEPSPAGLVSKAAAWLQPLDPTADRAPEQAAKACHGAVRAMSRVKGLESRPGPQYLSRNGKQRHHCPRAEPPYRG